MSGKLSVYVLHMSNTNLAMDGMDGNALAQAMNCL